MTPEWTVFSAQCPSRQSLARIANKWTAMVVILLHERPMRFGELHREVQGIAKKVLSDTLRALERDGMIGRSAHGDGHVRYDLTDLGRTLHEPLSALQRWAESHVEDVLDAQDRFDAAADEQILSS
ncbi:HxlR family transcriptional regulator [Labedella gwakjiensis]|uniref:Transcriptional regulator n=1 Tax=Labedella gwakjiensis TaxID=390269 RepID=A0A2P8GRB0_9MICO|nr:helix-turn-helix domain-containing protein [Labedella gwakjiensis]PSL36508.1 HxlR family transcriptional regulator [Labedella gwakjiensis]RUQ85574.1 transcriptional regulator [Labedella gwakjiensis]